MKTPHLNYEIEKLKSYPTTPFHDEVLAEYKAIKSIIENTPIVSTPDNPVWVVDKNDNKRILLADLGVNSKDRYILISKNNQEDFLAGKYFDWDFYNEITPYTEKVTIEVTKSEEVKVKEFLKTLRNGN
jgi:hypothetical protein